MPCAASPPSTFCQDQVTTSSLSHGSAIAKAAEVASQITRPSRSAAIQSPSGMRTPEVVPFQASTRSRAGSICGEIGQPAVGRGQHARIGELELLHDVGCPALGEALEGQHVDAARAEQRPQRHLDRAGIGGRHDAELPVRRACRAVRASGRSPRRGAPSARRRGGCGRAARPTAHRASSRDAWRRGRRRNWDWPDACPALRRVPCRLSLSEEKRPGGGAWPAAGI